VYLLTDPVGARAMGEKGLAWVDQEWRWDLVAEQLQRILIGESSSPGPPIGGAGRLDQE
jgi:phosphatidylinositol alpha-1,6-mannosyltransferase